MRRDELYSERIRDSYANAKKLPEPTRCTDCGAVFRGGRWTWEEAAPQAHASRCPACQRIHDDFPAGYVSLSGEFLGSHHDEILHLVRNHEAKEKAEHPLQRIMDVQEKDGETLVTTTDIHLARDIGEALHGAYKGELEYHYNKGQNLLRVSWRR